MRDEQRRDKKFNEERVAKNMNRISREIELSLFLPEARLPGLKNRKCRRRSSEDRKTKKSGA